MKRFLFFLVFVSAASVAHAQGVVQLSTYYPSPFGKYDRIQLVPRPGLTAPPCDPGTMYINADAGNQLEVCNAAGNAWAPISGGPWTQLGSDIYATDTAADVGIGTTTPTSRLHVNAPEGDAPPGVFLENTDITVNGATDGQFALRNNSASGTRKIFFGGPLADVTLTVDALNHRVGIGTTAPGGIFHVKGAAPNIYLESTTINGPDLYFSGSGTFDGRQYILYSSGSGNTIGAGKFALQDETAGATRLVVDSTGNVGIGTTTPNNKLQVAGLVNFNDTLFSTSLGYQAGNVNGGNYNTFVGYQAGTVNAAGASNVFIGALSGFWNTTGDGNVFIGAGAGLVNGSGCCNVFLGGGAGNGNMDGTNNTFVGFSAGSMNTSGITNTFIGNNAGALNTTGSNNILIGNGVENRTETTDNFLNIGNAIYGDLSTRNIGIGTGTNVPQNKLDVKGGVAVGVTYAGISAAPADGMIVEGNVGIGTTAPGTNKLEVAGGPIKATGGLIIQTCAGSVGDPCPGTPANGQMWLCTDTGDATPCNGI